MFQLVSDFCSGGSIESILKKFNFFDEKLIRKYIRQILEGLVHLHSLNMVHMNLKASNILVDSNGIIKISDYIEFNALTKFNSKKILEIQTNNLTGKIKRSQYLFNIIIYYRATLPCSSRNTSKSCSTYSSN